MLARIELSEPEVAVAQSLADIAPAAGIRVRHIAVRKVSLVAESA